MHHRTLPARPRPSALNAALASLLVLLGLTLSACSPSSPAPQAPGKLRVVATTGMIADIAARIAGGSGGRAQVSALMGEGVDPHLYKASPGDVTQLTQADVVLYNGLHLEGRMADMLEKLGHGDESKGSAHKGPLCVAVAETIDRSHLRRPPEFEGHPDPHVWFDVTLWMKAAERTRDALTERDPVGKEFYTARAAECLKSMAALHQWAHDQIATIPQSSRVLVTAHDAFGYFGRAYGLEVLAIQGISTDSEESIKHINALVDTLIARKIPAVFVESSVPHKTIEALVEGCKARGHSVAVGGELFSDAMGKAGTEDGTYEGMVRHNVRTIVKALGGAAAGSADKKAVGEGG